MTITIISLIRLHSTTIPRPNAATNTHLHPEDDTFKKRIPSSRLFHARHRGPYVNPSGGASLTTRRYSCKSLSLREMSSGTPSTTIQDESDTAFDLSRVFRHPAGLAVARYVVRTYIRAAENTLPLPAAETTTHSVPIPTFESSPEVTDLLQTILALNDSETLTLERDNARLGDLTMEGFRRNERRASDCE